MKRKEMIENTNKKFIFSRFRQSTLTMLMAVLLVCGTVLAGCQAAVEETMEPSETPLAAASATVPSAAADQQSSYVRFVTQPTGIKIYGVSGSTNNIKTVYGDNVWAASTRIDGTAVSPSFAGTANGGDGWTSGDIKIIQSADIVNDGAYVKVTYTITNNGASPHTIDLVSNCDVQIDTNDKAPITPNETGAMMSDGTKYQFNIISKNAYGVTDCDVLWFGQYNQRSSHLWTGEKTTATVSGIDSGLNIGWNGKVINPGQTKAFSYLMGIGTPAAPPQINGDISAVVRDTTVDVSAQVKDVSGSVDKLYYVLDMDTVNETDAAVLKSVTANGNWIAMDGQIPRPSSWQPGEVHTVSVWVMNQANAMSSIKTVAVLVLESEEGDVMKPAIPVTLQYVANGGSGTAPANKSTYELATIELANNTFTAPTGKKFAGWQAPDGVVYPASSNYELPENLSGTIQMKAYWINSDESIYYIDMYEQQTDGTYKLTESTLLAGTVGQTASATPRDAQGFTFNASKSNTSATIANAATPLHLALYYDRDLMNVTFVSGVTSTPERTVQVFYDSTVSEADIAPLADEAEATFGGWFTQSAGKGARFESTRRVKADTSVYAYWVPNNTAYTFDYNYVNPADTSLAGKTVTAEATLVADSSLPFGEAQQIPSSSFPADPERYIDAAGDTYRFIGWTLAGNAFTSDTRMALGTAGPIVAQWVKMHTLSIESAGEGQGVVSVTDGEGADPVRAIVDDGTRAIFSWAPADGSRVASVMVDGEERDDLLIGSTWKLDARGNHNVIVTFEPEEEEEVTGPDGGSTGGETTDPTDPAIPEPGTDPTDPVVPTPAPGTDPTVPTIPDGGDENKEDVLHHVTVESKGGVIAGLTPSQWVKSGTPVTVNWDPSKVASVYVDGLRITDLAVAAGNWSFPTVVSDHSIVVYAKSATNIPTPSTTAYYTVSTSIDKGDISASVSKKAGDSYQVTWIVADGYHVKSVLVNGQNVEADGTWTFNNIRANQKIRVVCEADDSTTSPVAPSVPGDGEDENENGNTNTNVGGGDDGGNENTNENENTGEGGNGGTNPPASKDFLIDTVIYGGPGSISPASRINEGTSTSVNWEVDTDESEKYPRYKVDTVVVDGAVIDDTDIEGGSWEFDDVNADHSVEVYLAPNLVNVEVITSGQGQVSSSATLFMGESYNVWATAADGWKLRAVYRNDEQIYPVEASAAVAESTPASEENRDIIGDILDNIFGAEQADADEPVRDFSETDSEVVENTEFRVIFSAENTDASAPRTPKYTVRTSIEGGTGSVSGSAIVDKSTDHTVTWTAGEGYRVAGVSVIRGGVEQMVFPTDNSLDINDIKGDVQVIVHLEADVESYDLTTALVGGSGNITPSVADIVPGTPVTVDWAAWEVHTVTMVEVDGVLHPELIGANSLDLVMDENHDVVVYVDGDPNPYLRKSAENKSNPGAPVDEGDVISYSIRVENRSHTALWTNVDISDKIPAGASYVNDSAKVCYADGTEVEGAVITYDEQTHTVHALIDNIICGKPVVLSFDAKAENTEEDLGNIAVAEGADPRGGTDETKNVDPVLPGGESDSDPETPDDPDGDGVASKSPVDDDGDDDNNNGNDDENGNTDGNRNENENSNASAGNDGDEDNKNTNENENTGVTPPLPPILPEPTGTGGVNVDVDGDGVPDVNIDVDGDGIPDVNIDVDGDGIPDVNIDTDGTGTWKPSSQGGNGDGVWKPDTNVDTDDTGTWKPSSEGGNSDGKWIADTNANNNGSNNTNAASENPSNDENASRGIMSDVTDWLVQTGNTAAEWLVQTGDAMPIIPLIGVVVGAAGVIIVLIVKRRKDE